MMWEVALRGRLQIGRTTSINFFLYEMREAFWGSPARNANVRQG